MTDSDTGGLGAPADRGTAPAGSVATVESVLGPVPADNLGWTLAHEHFFTKTYDVPGMYLANPRVAAMELTDAAAVGTRTVIDLTTLDMGRDPRALADLSTDVGVQIIMGTGWYTHKTYPATHALTSTQGLTEALLRDIEEGVDGIRPGVIGEIGVAGEQVEAREERVLRAVARAHRGSGLPVFLHQQRVLSGPAALEILREEGMRPEHVVFCHMDSIEDIAAHEIAAQLGVWLSYDRIQGWDLVFQLRPWEVEHRHVLLDRARLHGYLDRVLLSTDCCVLGDLARYGGPGYAYTHGSFAQQLRDRGYSDAELDQLFAQNPRRVLTGRPTSGGTPQH